MSGQDQTAGDNAARYSRATRRTGGVLACILEEPIGFAVPLFALIIFVSAPQMPDMFAGMVRPGLAWYLDFRSLGFGFASAFIGFSAWYWSRAGLMSREGMDDWERRALRKDRGRGYVFEPQDWAREWTPRIALLAAQLIACLPLFMTINIPGRTVEDAPIMASVSGIVLVLIALFLTRYRISFGLAGGLRASPIMWQTRTTSILGAAPYGWGMAVFLLLMSLVAAWINAEYPTLIERYLDAPSAGLLALGFLIGPMVMVLAIIRDLVELVLVLLTSPARLFTKMHFLDETADIAGLLLLLAILYAPSLIEYDRWFPEQQYRIRTTGTVLAGERSACEYKNPAAQRAEAALRQSKATGALSRPNIKDALLAWRKARITAGYPPFRPMPVIIVVAEGGASRAAVWLLSTMKTLDKATDGTFGRQLFAISGVSGGSLGAVTYLEALRLYGGPKGGLDWDNPAVETGIESLAGADLLSATVATYFLNDNIGWMLGQYWPLPDRSEALEQAFEREWQRGFRLTSDQAAEGLIALQQDGHAPALLPHLFLNGTDVHTGQRVITSTIKFSRRDDLFSASDDLLSILERDVPASVAVTNSARFPYLSPAGRFYDKCNGAREILDGGYFENYGARTASELALKIETLAQTESALRDLVPVVVVISNDADAYRSAADAEAAGGMTLWNSTISCPAWGGMRRSMPPGQNEKPDAGAANVLGTSDDDAPQDTTDDLGFESATPILGLYAAHGAHGQDALHILRRQLCPAPGNGKLVRMVHIALPKPQGLDEAAPMNWVLNPAAKRYLLGETGVFDIPYNKRQTSLLARTLTALRDTAERTAEPAPAARSQ